MQNVFIHITILKPSFMFTDLSFFAQQSKDLNINLPDPQ